MVGLVVLAGAGAWVASAATLSVGPEGDFATLVEAAAAAADGDVIEVAEGEYPGTVRLVAAVTVRAADPTAPPTLTADDVSIEVAAAVVLEDLHLRPGLRGVDVEPGATLTARGLDVRGATGDTASGLRATEATVTIEASTFSENVALDGEGGHIGVVGGELHVSGSTLEGGGARTGAAIHAVGAVVRLDETRFSSNLAQQEGGAVVVYDGELLVEACAFIDNQTTAEDCRRACEGGAVKLGGSVAWSVEGSLFEGNRAVDDVGGAIAARDEAVGRISSTEFVGNAGSYGGAVYLAGQGDTTVEASLFSGNTASEGAGGAIRWRPSGGEPGLVVQGATFDGNVSEQAGGALGINTTNGPLGSLVVMDSHFESNQASSGGGAISVTAMPSVEGLRNRFCRNVAATDGGAVRVSGSGEAAHRWSNNVFVDNEAELFGGGLALSDAGVASLAHNHILGGRSDAGGGIRAVGTTMDATNNLVAGVQSGTGLSLEPAAPLEWLLLWDNHPQDLGGELVESDLGEGVVRADPLLRGWGPDTSCDAPLDPLPGSPATDAGRPSDRDLDGSRADLGAYGGSEASLAVITDADSDGVFAIADCDDGDARVFPGALETCDGRDEDCDGVVDDDPIDGAVVYPDDDGDGFGDPLAREQVCDVPADRVLEAGDCDDSQPDVFPGAPESCDGRDEDCDGVVDGGLESTFYADGDADGFGDPTVSVQACSRPSGYATEAGDCDDASALIHPGAEDTPDDGIDQDCDGLDARAPVRSDSAGPRTEAEGCGCASGAPGGRLPVLLLLLISRRGRLSRSRAPSTTMTVAHGLVPRRGRSVR